MFVACSRARHQHEFHESDDVDDDGDDDECDEGMCGFSASDCEELLCQGIKPWDPEAGAALMVLNGFVD